MNWKSYIQLTIGITLFLLLTEFRHLWINLI